MAEKAYGMALCVILIASIAVGAAAWGREGHRLTCMIAEPFLSSESKAALEELLPGRDLPELCSWADDIRRSYRFRWTGPLHYIDTPDNLCGYDYDRDCHDSRGEKDMCVAGAINNYSRQLETFQEAKLSLHKSYNLTEALLFLAHYVGDIHQPLHVAFTADAGGNGVHVHWFGRKANLHHIWDTEFIDRAKRLYYHDIFRMLRNISMSITKENFDAWSRCETDPEACIDSYATESIHTSCRWAYKDALEGTYLEDDYFSSRLPIVEQRLAQGGVRLASILNRIFGAKSSESSI
ncbi:endonuclease 4 [Selaginella moellendorffii]|uniref:endonuclease 4 n=1 Tax=Selaginella moellendorffii TaxID=88036 RepID=UPI000D1C6F0A|nr:endonuclease 4 [Selaginella moellendorffii]|eukprot:XP_024526160.1 endonuclease 4 [Selaginella moellendorffii]